MSCSLIPPCEFDACVKQLREFFQKRGFVEVHTQNALSILAACEDPKTVASYNYNDQVWPLPQTGQMWLEHVLLQNPDYKGVFCVSTSYRNEPNPVPGRHDKIFPMFEFESRGGMDDLEQMEKELLDHLGFTRKADGEYPGGDYVDVAKGYGVKELEHEHESQLEVDHGPVFFLKNFPEYTSPFWNMRFNADTGISNKIDVIIHGMETIGSAERSTNKEEMRNMFQTISDGEYKDLLFDKFTQERVEAEMEEFLKYDFFPRYGGGIGVTRMISALKKSNLLFK